MNRITLLDRLSDLLGILSQKVVILNSNNEMSINIHAENILINIFNELFGGDFKNVNYTKGHNFPAIDLADIRKKIAIQVTASGNSPKAKSSLKKFLKYCLGQSFNQLYIYIITEKKKEYFDQKQFDAITAGQFDFDVDRHIWDKRDIYRKLNETNDLSKIEAVLRIIEKEFTDLQLPKISSPRKVALTFSEFDLEFALGVSEQLMNMRINVYTDSSLLEKRINKNLADYFIKFDDELPLSVDHCVVLFTEKFFREKWRDKHNRCPILNDAMKRHNIISLFSESNFSTSMDFDAQNVNIHYIKTNDMLTVVKCINEDIIKKEQRPTFRGYEDLLLILEAYRTNSEFKKKEIKEDMVNRIGFALYSERNKIARKIDYYYLYLYNAINQQKTFTYINDKHPEILKQDNLIILLPKEPGQKNLDIRKANIEKLFLPVNIFYLDEFLWEHCNPKEFHQRVGDEQFLDIENFVKPYLNNEEGVRTSFSFIEKWLTSDNEPLLVIKGGGGTGKTTVAKKISDYFCHLKDNSYVVFIDSKEILTELFKIFDKDEKIDLYKFYEAQHQVESEDTSDRLNKTLFKVNIDSGNILIIVDGLDEVIARLQNFDAQSFFDSIDYYSKGMGYGKVLVTCRDYFWNQNLDLPLKIDSVEILPFDLSLAKMFFQTKYSNSPSLVEKGMKISREFKLRGKNGNEEFIPFVLDVVDKIIESNGEVMEEDPSFDSNLLDISIKNDYILFRICHRETKKTTHIDLDDQILIFMHLAVFNDGKLTVSKLGEMMERVLNQNIDYSQVEAFKSHPLLLVSGDILSFRYDFFDEYFKSLYISNFLKFDSQEVLSPNLVNILADECKYHSGLVREISNRMKVLDDGKIIRINELVTKIYKFNSTLFKNNLYNNKKAVAGLFAIALKTNHNQGCFDISANTKLMKDIFGTSSKVISMLCILNLQELDRKKITFDFRGLTVEECFIENYENFWDCKFDLETRFLMGSFKTVMPKPYHKITLSEINFIDCYMDESLTEAFNKKKNEQKSRNHLIKEDLERFFRLFLTGGRLRNQPLDKTIKRRYNSINNKLFKIGKLVNFIEKEEVIEILFHNNIEYAEIRKQLRADVSKFINEGTVSIWLKNLIKNIEQNFNRLCP
jgi:hypothetical protein